MRRKIILRARHPLQEVHMRSLKIMAILAVGVWCLFAITSTTKVAAERGDDKIALLDDCDPRIAAGWNTATNSTGCLREAPVSPRRPQLEIAL